MKSNAGGLTIQCKVHFGTGFRGRKHMRDGEAPEPPVVEPGSTPRLSRLMALAIRFDKLVREGAVRDYAELARLGHVTRARLTQIMDLLNLAPDIQEEVLFLPRTLPGQGAISERQMRPIARISDWHKQRRMWQGLATQEVR
jgi:hypothetical protein